MRSGKLLENNFIMTKKKVKKVYRAKLDCGHSKVVGWPKFYHHKEKKTIWQTIRSMLF